jgi:hypothetical protein
MEADRFVAHPNPYGTGAFSGRQSVSAKPRIGRSLVTRMWSRGNPSYLGAGTAARIGSTNLQKPFESMLIGLCSAALPNDFSIPLKSENFEGAEHIIGNPGDHPRGVQVFDPK